MTKHIDNMMRILYSETIKLASKCMVAASVLHFDSVKFKKFSSLKHKFFNSAACSFSFSCPTYHNIRNLSTTNEKPTILDVRSTSSEPKITRIKKTDAEIISELKKLVKGSRVVLFMKGTPNNPQCQFSKKAVQLLYDVGCSDITFVDVLRSERVKGLIKQFSGWPTIPQLYINGNFVGGCDIMVEYYENGELRKLLVEAGVAFPNESENSNH